MAPTQDFKVNSVNTDHHYGNFKNYVAVGVQSVNTDPNPNPNLRQPVQMYTLFTHEIPKAGDILHIDKDRELRDVYGQNSTFLIYQPESTLSPFFNVRRELEHYGDQSRRLYLAERPLVKTSAKPGYEPQLCQIFSALAFNPGDTMSAQLVEEKKAVGGATLRYFQDEKYKKILSDSIRKFCV